MTASRLVGGAALKGVGGARALETVWLFNNPRAETARPRSRIVRARRVLESDGAGAHRFTHSD